MGGRHWNDPSEQFAQAEQSVSRSMGLAVTWFPVDPGSSEAHAPLAQSSLLNPCLSTHRTAPYKRNPPPHTTR